MRDMAVSEVKNVYSNLIRIVAAERFLEKGKRKENNLAGADDDDRAEGNNTRHRQRKYGTYRIKKIMLIDNN